MTDLKRDLDEYLLLQSDQKKNFKIDFNLKNIKVPKLNEIFTNKEQNEASNSWLRDTQESCCPKLTRIQRIIGFIICLGLGAFFMGLSTLYIPVLLLKARKFSLLFTLGSLFFFLSFSFLHGFLSLLKQMFSKERLYLSLSYMTCLIGTLYFAMWVQSTALTVVFAAAQIITLLFMLLAAIPGGVRGAKFFGQMFKSSVSNTLPV